MNYYLSKWKFKTFSTGRSKAFIKKNFFKGKKKSHPVILPTILRNIDFYTVLSNLTEAANIHYTENPLCKMETWKRLALSFITFLPQLTSAFIPVSPLWHYLSVSSLFLSYYDGGGLFRTFLSCRLFPTYYQPSLSKIILHYLPPLKTLGLKDKTFRGFFKRGSPQLTGS